MCSPWKRTFTLVPLTPLTMFSSIRKKSICKVSKVKAITKILDFFTNKSSKKYPIWTSVKKTI